MLLGLEQPAAILPAEILSNVGDLHQLVGIDGRVLTPANDDVGTGAGIRGDGGLRSQILPAHEINSDRYVELPVEFLGVVAEDHLVRLKEAGGTEDAQGRAVLDWKPWRLNRSGRDGGPGLPQRHGGECPGGEAERTATVEAVIVSI